ncbi:MAG: hypothetical protein A2965_00570 [Candidatus Levybacteria bacterium RIFCSPLOWO2_01_FULL_40_96]|nr:MAG: hypothetical protein UT46_C0004G0032 [Candidatus Levybacteria bacterium GW2011_GWA1_39_34]OGH41266.1 MAG: hypothetical protein A2965_00570 [Candidatus Levybacteria bacterium RIFCSPLOWO2_01_FULL_40_96]
MTTENKAGLVSLCEGPFIVTLTRPLRPGLEAEGLRRYILGGPTGSAEKLNEALEEIRAIDKSLPFADYTRAAGKVFRSHNLIRIDH